MPYLILEHFCSKNKNLFNAQNLLRDTTWKTCLGQHMDNHFSYTPQLSMNSVALSDNTTNEVKERITEMKKLLNEENFMNISMYKTGFYTFVCPILLGIYCAEVESILKEEVKELIIKISLNIGVLFQAKVSKNSKSYNENIKINNNKHTK